MEHHLDDIHPPLKIALVGYGKMGKILRQKADEKRFQIASIISSKSGENHAKAWEAAKNADVCIDFTESSSLIENVKQAARIKKNIVVGTTGWLDSYDEVKAIVEQAKIGFLYSPNFSLGVALFLKLIEKAGELIGPFKQYDIAGVETHHRNKADIPSGTAIAIKEKLKQPSLKFSSVRVGSVPGTHTLIFDSSEDTITLSHAARNRDGFAVGALTAAAWLKGKQGIYTLNDLLKETIK